jgi:uncharacterized protein (DUF2267 family)
MNTTMINKGDGMTVEEAAAAELGRMPVLVRESALAAAVLVLARRLDAGPGDAVASMLVRELRQALVALHAQAGGAQSDELDQFLASISASEFGN